LRLLGASVGESSPFCTSMHDNENGLGHDCMRKGVEAVRGTVAHDMGILTALQLHWKVQSFNNGVPASESDYFQQLI
jgi:hypothetical protein